MLDKLDVKLMRLLILLYENRSISRVSESLGISQQAVSGQLKTLRSIFEDRLFIRYGHGVAPTPKAEQLCKAFGEIITTLDEVSVNCDFDPLKVSRTFVVSASDYSQEVLCTSLFKLLREQAPRLNLIVTELAIDSLQESLTKGQIDLAITIPQFLPPNIPYTTLFHESYRLVTSRESKVMRIGSVTELNEFEHIIVSPARSNLKGSSQAWFDKHNIRRNIVASIPSFSLLEQYMSKTDVLAFVPSKMLPLNNLKELPIEPLPPGFEVVAAWHPKVQQDPLYQWLISKLKEISRELS